MICLMPFTYIEADKVAAITGALGPVAVCALLPETVPDHLRPLAEQQVLSLLYPKGVRADDLKRALAEFKAWADMHRGKISEMIAFQKTMNGRVPFVDDTYPTQLGDQIRHFSDSNPHEAADPLFKSALFLFMAQEHDRQEDAVASDLGAVQVMEKEMLARLSGPTLRGEQELPDEETLRVDVSVQSPNLGSFMTPQRVQAWARLTSRGDHACSTFVTTSPAVYAYLLEKFPEAGDGWTLKPRPMPGEGAGRLDELLEALSQVSNPGEWPSETTEILPAVEGIADLTLSPLIGVPPWIFLDRLSDWPLPAARTAGDRSAPLHTIIGLLNLS
jgi:hypothetical protein